MKSYHKPMARRQFLQTGIAGGAVFGMIPIRRLFSSLYVKRVTGQRGNLSRVSIKRLRRIAKQYGGELGKVRME